MHDTLTLEGPAGSTAALTPHGAQLLSWRTHTGEHLYASPRSAPAPARAVRGGVPVCFPQFAARGPLAKHGFARQVRWRVGHAVGAEALLTLDDRMTPAGTWPHRFHLSLQVKLQPDALTVELLVHNPGAVAWSFTGALHTYFATPDVRTSQLHGLQGTRYEDTAAGGTPGVEDAHVIRIRGEHDRIHFATPPRLVLERPGLPALAIEQAGFLDTVVWNPGPTKAATLGDMPPEDWTRMLCVEAAAVGVPVEVQPGATWRGLQRVRVLPEAPNGRSPA